MPNRFETLKAGKTQGCAICDRKFGLIRHYSWRTPLCSRSCVDRFRSRRSSDFNWAGWLQLAFDHQYENRVRDL